MMEKKMDMKKEITRLRKKVGKWVAEWICADIFQELFWDEPRKSCAAIAEGNGSGVASVSVATGNLATWHFNQYAHATLNEGRHRWDELALCAHYGVATIQFEEAFASADQGGSVLQEAAVRYFSLCVIAGWRLETATVGWALRQGLDTHLLDLRHTERHQAGEVYRHFWFLMHLYCDASGVTMNIADYSYPDSMEPYDKVLSDWRTTDLDKVQFFVSAMADFHVAETRPTRYEELAEFDGEDDMLFPYEILCFLRLREWAGLANPEHYEHPLMNQPLAQLPPSPPLDKPDTPLLDQVIAKFKLEYPDSFA